MTVMETVKEIVYDVREKQGGHPEKLLGNCIENAEELKKEIEKRKPEWDVYISYGALDLEDENTPNSYVEAKKDGLIHHWVVVKTPEETVHCDLATESPYCIPPGDHPMIQKDSPISSYIDFGHRRDS